MTSKEVSIIIQQNRTQGNLDGKNAIGKFLKQTKKTVKK
jgi:hypothetical protein